MHIGSVYLLDWIENLRIESIERGYRGICYDANHLPFYSKKINSMFDSKGIFPSKDSEKITRA